MVFARNADVWEQNVSAVVDALAAPPGLKKNVFFSVCLELQASGRFYNRKG